MFDVILSNIDKMQAIVVALSALIGAIVTLLYGGNSVYQSNVSTQQKLIESIERLQGD